MASLEDQNKAWLRGPLGFRDRCVFTILQEIFKQYVPKREDYESMASEIFNLAEALTKEREKRDASV